MFKNITLKVNSMIRFLKEFNSLFLNMNNEHLKIETYKHMLLRSIYAKTGTNQSSEVSQLELKLLSLAPKEMPTVDTIKTINKAHYAYLREVLGDEQLFDNLCEVVLIMQSDSSEIISHYTDLLSRKLNDYCTDLNDLTCYLESASKLLSDASEL